MNDLGIGQARGPDLAREGGVKSPQEKYRNDPQYKALVDHMVFMIQACQFTPSELREAAVLASIRYEELNPRINWKINMELEKALDVIAKFKSGEH